MILFLTVKTQRLWDCKSRPVYVDQHVEYILCLIMSSASGSEPMERLPGSQQATCQGKSQLVLLITSLSVVRSHLLARLERFFDLHVCSFTSS